MARVAGLAWSLCRAPAALPALVPRPSCSILRPGTAETVGAMRGCKFPSPPPPSRALDPTSRRRTGAPWQWSSFGRLAPAWAAFLCLRVEGDPSELPGHVDTARTARRPPLVVAHGSTFDAHETCCTARRLRWSASSPLPAQALRGPGCAGRGGQGSLTEPRDEDCATPPRRQGGRRVPKTCFSVEGADVGRFGDESENARCAVRAVWTSLLGQPGTATLTRAAQRLLAGRWQTPPVGQNLA
jgi:hypothetical protein